MTDTTDQERRPQKTIEHVLEASDDGTVPGTQSRTVAELVEALRGVQLERLPGHGVRRSRFTMKQMAKDSPLEKKKKRAKPKGRRDVYLRKRKLWAKRYREASLLDCDRCWKLYEMKYKDRWVITLEEWRNLWEEYGLEGVSPIVSPLRAGPLDLYNITIRPRQEQKIRGSTIYDGEDKKLYDMML